MSDDEAVRLLESNESLKELFFDMSDVDHGYNLDNVSGKDIKQWLAWNGIESEVNTADGAFGDDFYDGVREMQRYFKNAGLKPDGIQYVKGTVKKANLDIKNPYIHDYNGSFDDVGYADIIKKAKELGHDGVIIKNTKDPLNTNLYIPFSEKQIIDKDSLPDSGVSSLLSEMKAEQAKVEPFGLTRDLGRLNDIENGIRDRTRIKDMGDYNQYGDVKFKKDAPSPEVEAQIQKANEYSDYNMKWYPQAMEKPQFQAANELSMAVTGKPVITYESMEKGQGYAIGDQMYLNGKSKQPTVYVAAHETAHVMETTAPEHHAKLKQIALDHIADTEGINNHYVKKYGYDASEVPNELTADMLADCMTKDSFWQRVRVQAPEIIKPVLDVIDGILAKAREFARVPNKYDITPYMRDVEVMREKVAVVYRDYLQFMKKQGLGVEGAEKMAAKTDGKLVNATDTPEFKQWFGDSKVVDEQGNPLVVYHNTNADFNAFDVSKSRQSQDIPGIFFTDSSTEWADMGKRQIQAHLSIKNPYIGNYTNYKGIRGGSTDTAFQKIRDALIKDGYDGIITKDGGTTEYIAFFPEQVKSVNNRGTWDPTNPDIRYKKSEPDHPLKTFGDLAISGAEKLKTANQYQSWTSAMMKEHGAIIEKQLPYIWNRSKELVASGETTIKYKGYELPVKWEAPKAEATATLGKGATKTVAEPNGDIPAFADNGYDTAQSINSVSDLKEPLNLPEKLKQFYRKAVDSRRVLNDVDEYMRKTTGKGLDTTDKLYILGTNSSSAEGMAQQTMETHMVGMTGEVVGESFGSVLKKASNAVGGADNWRVFEDYNKLKHAMAWMRQGRNVYPEEAGLGEVVGRIKKTVDEIDKIKGDKTLNAEQKDYVIGQLQSDIDEVASQIEQNFVQPRIANIEQQFPNIGQSSKEYSDWIAKFGEEWGVKSGLISPEEWASLRQEYPDYVPLQRVMDEVEEGLMGTGAGFANQSKPIKKGRGSERNTIESVEVMIERIPSYIKTAKRNEVAQNLYRMMEESPEEMAEAWGKIVTVKPGDPIKPNVITARVNGKEVSMELTNPALLEGMSGLSKEGQGVVVEGVRAVTSMMKTLTTGVNPLFSIGKNIFYDTPSAYGYSRTLSKIPGTPLNNPVEFAADLVDSLFRIVTNEKWHKEKYLQMYRDMGGGSFASSSADRNLLAESKARIMPGYLRADKPVQSLGRGAKMGYQGLQKIMSVTETLPRLPEFKRVIQKEGNSYDSRAKGLYEANDITFNFSRHGDAVKFLDAFVPYLNAAVQGLDKFARTAKENPAGLAANAIIAVTIPEMVLYSINHDDPAYQQLSEATKSRYYCFPKGDGKFLKIVKPREIGVLFGTAITDVMEYMKDNDPAEFDSLKMGLKNSFFPPDRTLFAPFSDLKANKDFSGTPIVPGYLEGLSPEYQADANTSAPAKAIGKALNQSPKQIDYLFKSYGGVLAQIGQPATSEGGSAKEVIKRQFEADPTYSNDIFTKFYDEQNKLNMADKNVKAGHPDPEDNPEKRKYYGRVARNISDLRKVQRMIESDESLDAETKKQKLDTVQRAMLKFAQEAMETSDYNNSWAGSDLW